MSCENRGPTDGVTKFAQGRDRARLRREFARHFNKPGRNRDSKKTDFALGLMTTSKDSR